MLANHAVLTFPSMRGPADVHQAHSPEGLHALKRRTSVVFDVKMMGDHVYVVVDDEDLVKSHLLLAVREEVDVLKASISQLVDKISVLERENRVLKTNASPEVLAQLGQSPRNASLRQGAARRPLQAPAAAPDAGNPRQTRPATP